MNCPNLGLAHSSNAKFCSNFGTPFTVAPPTYGTPYAGESRIENTPDSRHERRPSGKEHRINVGGRDSRLRQQLVDAFRYQAEFFADPLFEVGAGEFSSDRHIAVCEVKIRLFMVRKRQLGALYRPVQVVSEIVSDEIQQCVYLLRLERLSCDVLQHVQCLRRS